MGIQGVTRGYRGLQVVTRGYRGLFFIKIKVEKMSNF